MTLEELRRVPLFADLSDEDLEQLHQMATTIFTNPGELVFEEGSPGDALYAILEGELEVTKRQDGRDVVLAVRRAGEFIGEMPCSSRDQGLPRCARCKRAACW